MKQPRANKSPRQGVFARLGAIMNRAASAVSMRLHVTMANAWRDNYNPLRSLTIMRAVHLLEDGERGAYADLQWTYRFIEMQDATLGALVERRTSAIQELDWDIKTHAKIPTGKEQVAALQAAALQKAYNKISNLSAAFEALEMAAFRGFTRLEKVRDGDGDIVELAPVDQWFWVRAGLYGAWQLNRNSTLGATVGDPVPDDSFVTREVSRPINRVALIAFVRKSLSQKDWDGFIETYGIPAVFIVMPDNVPEGKSDEYLEMADQVTGDARGVLPGGSDVKTVDNGARGVNPFKDHISYQDEQVVLRGTGGKLTMLAESGSGTLAGNAHADTFAAIARAEAKEISEILRKCIDAEVIERATPGEEAYAYFELAANEEKDPAQVVKDLVELEGVGLEVDEKFIEQKTGYPVKRKVEIQPTTTASSPSPSPAPLIMNRAPEQQEDPAWMAALSVDMQPLGKALAGALQAGDEAATRAALKKISERMPEFLESAALEAALADKFVNALGGKHPIHNSGNRAGAIKGWETRRHNGWQAKPKSANEKVSALVDAALADESGADSFVNYADVTEEEAALLGLEPGYRRAMSANSVRHMMNSHGDPLVETPRGQIAITADDIKTIPEIIARSQAAKHEGSLKSGNDTIRYFYDDPTGGTTTVLDEVRIGRRKLVPLQMIKFKGAGIRSVPEPKHNLKKEEGGGAVGS